jgi:flagellar protein FliL
MSARPLSDPMSETKPAAEEGASAPATGGGKKKLVLISILVGGLVAGTALGLFVVGPKFVGAPEAHAATTDSTEHEDGEAEGGEDGEGGAESSLHVIENIVLNPARSGGTRFLMMGAAFEAKDGAVVNQLKARDAETRDVVLRVMGAKTVDELAETSNRERLKAELIDSMNVLFKKGAIRRVYFPQFVIQ